MSPSRVAEALADGLAADPLFCDLLGNLHCTSNTRWISTKLSKSGGPVVAAVMSLADVIEQALPALGRSGALDVLLAAHSLAAPLWQIAHPPPG